MSDLVRLEVEDGIGTIRLDRPPMNALNAEIQRGLIAASREAAERRDVSAVIVWGGEKVFAAGADVTYDAVLNSKERPTLDQTLERVNPLTLDHVLSLQAVGAQNPRDPRSGGVCRRPPRRQRPEAS